MGIQVNNLKAVIHSIEKKVKEKEKNFEVALKRAGLLVQRDAQKLTPVDTSFLKNSAGTRHKGSGFNTIVYVYFTANYALFVHENLEAYHKPPTQAKFLETSLRQNREKISKMLKEATG